MLVINDDTIKKRFIPFSKIHSGDFFILENNLYVCLSKNTDCAYNFDKGIEEEINYNSIVNPVEIEMIILKNP